jgi:TRAP-type uncharacterized transport system substrate-binding protein
MPKLVWRRRRGWLALALAVVGLGLAGAFLVAGATHRLPRITLTAGPLNTTRAVLGGALVNELVARGVDARLVETRATDEQVAEVEAGRIDFALVSGTYRIELQSHLREAAPLHVEALHLLVKQELADAASRSLDALRGHSVDLGPRGSGTAALAEAVLGFAGIGTDAIDARYVDLPDALGQADQRRNAMPDAIAHVGTVPSKVALDLIRSGGYRPVPVMFAEAFRLGALLSNQPGTGAKVDRRSVSDVVIPAYTYGADPPTPAEPLHTLGVSLVLITNDRVPTATVAAVVDTVFGSPFARLTTPVLDATMLKAPPRLPFHAGTLAYLDRDKPYLRQQTLSNLGKLQGLVGSLVGGVLFLWQWRRRRDAALRDETFGTYLLRVVDIEQRVAGLELADTLDLEALAALQREVLELKQEALERFAAGDLGDQATLSDLLTPLNAARDHIADLILHVRTSIESRAEAEGRSAKALWAEAIDERATDGES